MWGVLRKIRIKKNSIVRMAKSWFKIWERLLLKRVFLTNLKDLFSELLEREDRELQNKNKKDQDGFHRFTKEVLVNHHHI